MSADLAIHVFTDELSMDDIATFFCSSLGTEWFNPLRAQITQRNGEWMKAYEKLSRLPHTYVGEVSWLKALLTDDTVNYVPTAIEIINKLIGHSGKTVIDQTLLNEVAKALMVVNTTDYQLEDTNKIMKFLNDNMGKKAIVVSW